MAMELAMHIRIMATALHASLALLVKAPTLASVTLSVRTSTDGHLCMTSVLEVPG